MIIVNNLSFNYKGSKINAIEDINFEIGKGEIFGFLGPSGAGKTTTQKLLIGLLKNYNGEINILNKERKDWDSNFYEKIGVAFEFPNMYLKLTAKENLTLIQSYYQNTQGDIDYYLEKVGLLKDKNRKVSEFSKGMKMRLNFVRSILHNPDLLFLDEPTSGLDPVNGKIVKNMILDLKNKNKTIFLTTHDMNVAQELCDRIALIDNGEIIVIDTPKNLMINHGEPEVKIEYLKENNLISNKFSLNKLHANQEFMKVINSYEIKTMHSEEATLEDVFIKLTGRKL
ncbi:MAG TPA: ABC transporter ATP-binding protein [Clostridia bacterium]|nr:ABC transporter ATP-binding protein [Clostridia bacterium]